MLEVWLVDFQNGLHFPTWYVLVVMEKPAFLKLYPPSKSWDAYNLTFLKGLVRLSKVRV